MNIAVIKLRDLIKYIFCFIIIIVIISVILSGITKKEEFEKQEEVGLFKNSSFLHFLKIEFPLIANQEKEEKEPKEKKGTEKMLGMGLTMMENLEDEEIEENENFNKDYNEKIAEENVDSEEKIETTEQEVSENKENLNIEVIEENNIKASYTDNMSNVKINNQTDYDIKDIIANPNYEITNKEKIIIYHTHTCESYTSSESYKYEMTGSYRTTDLNYTVSRVGDELEKYLKNYGKTVIHDKTYHDYPSYNGSYGRSLQTLEGILEKNKDAEIAIDLHRDAIGSSNTYGPRVKIGEDMCAQVMFVIGTDGSRIISSKLETKSRVCHKDATNCK